LYHINEAGNPGFCKATHGNCPFGKIQDHYTSKEAARNAFEEKMNSAGHKNFVARSIKLIEDRTIDVDFSSPKFGDQARELRIIDKMLESGEIKASPDAKAVVLSAGRKISDSVYSEGKLHEDRFAAILETGDPRPMIEVLSSGTVTVNSKPARLTDAESRTAREIGRLSDEGKKALYALPVSYIGAISSRHTIKPHGVQNIETLIRVATVVRAQEPNFVPADSYMPPSRVQGYKDSTRMPRMQNLTPKSHDLLRKYAEQKYGAKAPEFWDTVVSNSSNYPKVSDFSRAEKAFDKS